MADRRSDERPAARRRPRTPVAIPYSTIEAVAAELHGVGQAGLAALRARLHSLRRLDFPNRVSGSSGRHFDYGLADLIGVLAALELAEAYLPPAAAAAIVREGWPEIARCALSGIGRSTAAGVVEVHPNALFQALSAGGDRTSDTLHVEVAALAPASASRRTIDIAIGALARRAMHALERIDRRAHAIASGQLPELTARFGDGRPLPRPDHTDGRLISDGPYWSRAASLVAAIKNGPMSESSRRRSEWHLGYIARPAPVEAWKMRIAVDPGIDDVGYAAALATLAHRAGLRSSRAMVSTEKAERAWQRLTRSIGDRDAVATRLAEIAEKGARHAAVFPQPPKTGGEKAE